MYVYCACQYCLALCVLCMLILPGTMCTVHVNTACHYAYCACQYCTAWHYVYCAMRMSILPGTMYVYCACQYCLALCVLHMSILPVTMCTTQCAVRMPIKKDLKVKTKLSIKSETLGKLQLDRGNRNSKETRKILISTVSR